MPNIIGEAAYRVTADTSGFRRQAETGVGRRDANDRPSWLDRGCGGIGAAFIGMGLAVRRGFNEFADSQRVMAQTRAVLKSTGGEAGVTAKHVTELATSLSHMSGIDDETVQASENLLLTFTNVKNFVHGQFVGTFDEATRAIADVATAMASRSGGELDLQSATLQVGKALQDPVRGMTALRRVGVNFSQSQQDLVKHLVDTGHTLDAQRIILKELHKEFGGSAEAAGNTLPGALNKLNNAFDEAMGKMVATAAPALTSIIDGLLEVSNFLGDVFAHKKTSVRLRLLWEGASSVATDLWAQFLVAWNGQEASRTPVKVGGRIIDFETQSATEGLSTKLHDAIASQLSELDWGDVASLAWDGFVRAWQFQLDQLSIVVFGIGPKLMEMASKVNWGEVFAVVLNRVTEKAHEIVNSFVDAWVGFDHRVAGFVQNMVGSVISILSGLVGSAANLARNVVQGIVQPYISLAARVGGFVADMVGRGLGLLRGFVGSAGSAAQSIVGRIVDAFSGIAGKIGGKLSTIGGTIHNALSSVANQAFGWATGLGARIVEGIASGIRGAAGAVTSAVGDVVGSAISKGADLVPGSPRGPLEHAVEEHLTSRFVNAFTSGIAAASPLMAAAIGGAVGAGTVEAGAGTTNNRTVNVGQVILPTVTNGGDLVRQLDALVARPG